MNFVPCEECSGVMYCDRLCERKNVFHKFVCDMVLETNHCCDELYLPFILRSIIVGINSFETIAEMMECVAQWISSDPLEITESLTSPIFHVFERPYTTAKQRFLVHLIMHHCGISQTNRQQINKTQLKQQPRTNANP